MHLNGKNLSLKQEIRVPSLDKEDPLEKGMAAHSTILASRLPWTEQTGRIQSLWSQRVRHNWEANTGFQQESAHRCDGAKLRGNLRKLGKWFPKAKAISFIHFPYCISFFKDYIYNKGRMWERKKKKKGHNEGWTSKWEDDNNLQKNHWSQFRNWCFSFLFLSNIQRLYS